MSIGYLHAEADIRAGSLYRVIMNSVESCTSVAINNLRNAASYGVHNQDRL